MKSVNNKIKKPFISVGFDNKGNLSFNIDLNKTNKLNDYNYSKLMVMFGHIKNKIRREAFIQDMDGLDFPSSTPPRVQQLKVLNDYYFQTNISFNNVVTLDELMKVEVNIKNNMKLQAIKSFKDASGCGLKDSKDFIEWYTRKLNIKFNYNR